MKKAKASLSIALTLILCLAASCSRAPEQDQASAPAGSSAAEANSTSAERLHKPSSPAASAPNQASIGGEMQSRQESVSDLSAEFFSRTEIDLNSGDLRSHRFPSGGPPPNVIFESQLSREVRRLGIPIPEERRWTTISSAPGGGMHITYAYRNLLPAADRLLRLFEEVKATDEERRDVLERLMTYLRTEKLPTVIDRPDMLFVEVSDRHGLESPFRPDYKEHLRQLQRDRAQQ